MAETLATTPTVYYRAEWAALGIDDVLRLYCDAAGDARVAEAEAGPRAETDPAVDSAWELVAALRVELGLRIRSLEDAARGSPTPPPPAAAGPETTPDITPDTAPFVADLLHAIATSAEVGRHTPISETEAGWLRALSEVLPALAAAGRARDEATRVERLAIQERDEAVEEATRHDAWRRKQEAELIERREEVERLTARLADAERQRRKLGVTVADLVMRLLVELGITGTPGAHDTSAERVNAEDVVAAVRALRTRAEAAECRLATTSVALTEAQANGAQWQLLCEGAERRVADRESQLAAVTAALLPHTPVSVGDLSPAGLARWAADELARRAGGEDATHPDTARMAATLATAADVFDEYAYRHAQKGTAEGDRKADANRAMAAMCRDVLGDYVSSPAPRGPIPSEPTPCDCEMGCRGASELLIPGMYCQLSQVGERASTPAEG